MSLSTTTTHAPLCSGFVARPNTGFGDLYLHLLRPNGNGPERVRKLRDAAKAYEPHDPHSAAAMEQFLT